MTISPLRAAPDKSDFPKNAGRPPQMLWLPLAELVVDDEYQRDILWSGLNNIRRIAAQLRVTYAEVQAVTHG